MWKLEQKHLKCREAMFSQWLLHTVSVFSSEPASCFAATVVLKAFCGIYFIDSLFSDFQSFYFTSLFLPLQSIWFAPWVQPGLPWQGQTGLASHYFLRGTFYIDFLLLLFFSHQMTPWLHQTPPLTQTNNIYCIKWEIFHLQGLSDPDEAVVRDRLNPCE